MGDGYYSNSVMICTDNFTEEEVIKLINVLEKKFFISASIRKRKLGDKSVSRIYIKKSSLDSFNKLIIPYMIPEMF